MRRLPSTVYACFLVGVLGPLQWACGAAEPLRPNLALVTVDALRADRLECYGGLPGLGEEVCGVGQTGARYVWAFSTSSSGAPAAASLLTSQYPRQHGVRLSAASFLTGESVTLAETLRRAGYSTAAFVGSAQINRSRNFQQGFDLFDDRAASASAEQAPSPSEAAVAWAARAKRPWFLWVHHAEPRHPPSAVGATDAPDRARRDEASDRNERRERAIRRLDRRLSQLIAVLDSQPSAPGVLLAALNGRGPDEPAEPGRSLGLERLRVPLLWRPPRAGPGRGVGRRVSTPVSVIDIAPTLLQAAGIARPNSFVGRALPYGDPAPGRAAHATRSLFAEDSAEVAIIRGSEYCALERREGVPGTAPLRSARLWPHGDRGRERLPEYDDPESSRERIERLEAELTSWASGAGSLPGSPSR